MISNRSTRHAACRHLPSARRCLFLLVLGVVVSPTFSLCTPSVASADDPSPPDQGQAGPPILVWPEEPLVPAARVGNLPGAGSVAATGEYRYRLPIEVPPGRAGMQPSLSLAYSSRGRNGHLGVGWQLEGLSEISRCPSVWASEGTMDGVHVDGTDAFCLDGHKLVSIGGAYGGDHTQYRTKDDTFAKIVSYADENRNVTEFVVWTKDGRERHYRPVSIPGDPSYNPLFPADPANFAWPLAEERDRAGNAVCYQYQVDAAPGHIEYYPREIDYSCRTSGGAVIDSGRRRVLFSYEGRSDQPFAFVGGHRTPITQRLKEIQLHAPNPSSTEMVWRYTLSYDESPTSGLSRLHRVERCGALGGCLPFKEFHWHSSGGPAFESAAVWFNAEDGWAPVALDVDGDGKDEILSRSPYTAAIHLRSTVDPAKPLEESTLVSLWLGPYPVFIDKSMPVDLDGDGAHELVGLINGPNKGYYAFRWNPVAKNFAVQPGPLEPTTHEASATLPFEEPLLPVDLDGDGLPDLVKGEQQSPDDWSWFFRKNQAGVLGPKVSVGISGKPVFTPNGEMWSFAQDFAGDYRGSALVTAFQDGDPTHDALHGIRLDRAGQPDQIEVAAHDPSAVATVFADLNGDGLRDEVRYLFATQQLCVHWKTGGSQAKPGPCKPFAFASSHEWRVADLDGDGEDELLLNHEDGGVRMLRLGATGELEVEATDLPELRAFTQIGDFDGDGRPDLAYWLLHTLFVFKATIETTDRIDEVRDELDPWARERVTYEATWSPTPDLSTCQYPQRCMRNGLTVVREHQLYQGEDIVRPDPDPQPGTNYVRRLYNYEGPRFDLRGQGFLGFETVRVWEPERGAETITTYDNVTSLNGFYYRAFRPKTVQRAVALTGQSGTARITRIQNTYQVDHLNQDRTYFVHPQSWSSLEWEEDVTVSHSADAKVHITHIDGPAERGLLRARNGLYEYDSYGNVTSAYEATAGGVATYVTSTYEIRLNDWLVSLLHTRAVWSGVPGTLPLPVPRHTEYAYDARGLITDVFVEKNNPDPSLSETSTFARDPEDGLIASITASAPGEAARTTLFGYEPSERVHQASVTNAAGHVQRVRHHPAFGVPVVALDENEVESRWQYDDAGRVRRIERGGEAGTTVDYANRYSNGDVVGTTVVVTGDAGGVSATHYDAIGRVAGAGHLGFDGTWIEDATRRDLLGRIVERSRPGEGAPSSLVTTFSYDGLDRLLLEEHPGGESRAFVHSFSQTHVYDPMQHHRYVVRDVDGRVMKSAEIDDQKHLVTKFWYGPFGDLVRVTDPKGHEIVNDYDPRGRRVYAFDPDAGPAYFTYNGFGETTTKVLGFGVVTQYHHDALGRVTQVDDGDGTTTYDWDASPHGKGRLSHTESPDGTTQDFAYDPFGRSTTRTWTVDGEAFSFDTTYDENGRVKSLAYPEVLGRPRFKVGRDYTASDYLHSVHDGSTWVKHDLWTAETRNADDRLTLATLGNGLSAARAYDDETGRLTSLIDGAALSLSYGYDGDGMVQQRKDHIDNRIDVFSYDTLHRLRGWERSSFIPGLPGLPDAASVLHATEYQYDDLGNLTKVLTDGVLKADNTYDPQGLPHAIVGSLQGSFGYDGRGRQVDAPGRTVTYTEFDLPRTITTAAGVTSFSYDAAGARVKKDGPSGAVVSLARLYERRESGAAVEHVFYVQGGEGLVAEVVYGQAPDTGADVTETRYLHLDPLGSVGAVTDASGDVVQRMHHEPFGARSDANGMALAAAPPSEPFGFAGHRHDDDLGLIDMRGRVYDPMARRFLTPDPHVTDPLGGQSYNRYSYVVNNPTNLVDPTGFDWWDGGSGCIGLECLGGGGWSGKIGTDVDYYGPWGGKNVGGGTSVPKQPSGGPVNAAELRRSIGLPTGGEAPGMPTAGPQAQAWGDPRSQDFYDQVRLDIAERIAYDMALWEANAEARARRALSTREDDEFWWSHEGSGGAPPVGYAHDSLVQNLNAGHTRGVEQVANAVTVAQVMASVARLGFATMRVAAAEVAGARAGRTVPFNPSGSTSNCVNSVCAFLNSVQEGRLVPASADVATNGGSIARANAQIVEATGVRMSRDFQVNTLNTARARQFFVVYPGTSAHTANHVLIGINNGGKIMLYDPQIGAKIFDVGSYGSFVAFPVAF